MERNPARRRIRIVLDTARPLLGADRRLAASSAENTRQCATFRAVLRLETIELGLLTRPKHPFQFVIGQKRRRMTYAFGRERHWNGMREDQSTIDTRIG